MLSPAREVPKAQAEVRRPPPSTNVSDSQDSASVARAYLECGYTQQEIADHLGVHYSTISRRVRSVDNRRLRNTARA
ncbi:MAG: helix-turn-helix domain-containing protein [Candidatus Bipolaricaulota bacterium]|nr:helix-turn-helix domain-containing protein [Candidatus Bipolaricaulota bacterium]